MLKQAVFLVGGRGTRLGPLTDATPKPLLPVAGRPFLDYLIDNAARQGFSDIVLLCGYLASVLAQHYAGPGPHGSTVRLVVEPEPAGTAGALLYARELLDDRFLMCNGDSLFACDLAALQERAGEADRTAFLALRRSAPGRRSGTVRLVGNDIRSFHAPEENVEGPVNAGVYVIRRDLLDWIGPPPCSIEQDVFPRLAADGRLGGGILEGYFIDIGVPEDYERANREVAAVLAVDR